jgi:hypothetical protein
MLLKSHKTYFHDGCFGEIEMTVVELVPFRVRNDALYTVVRWNWRVNHIHVDSSLKQLIEGHPDQK